MSEDRIEADLIIEFLAEQMHDMWVLWSEDLLEKENISEDRVSKWSEFLCDWELLPEDIKKIDREFAQSMFIMMLDKFPDLVNILVLKEKDDAIEESK